MALILAVIVLSCMAVGTASMVDLTHGSTEWARQAQTQLHKESFLEACLEAEADHVIHTHSVSYRVLHDEAGALCYMHAQKEDATDGRATWTVFAELNQPRSSVWMSKRILQSPVGVPWDSEGWRQS